MAKTHKPGQDSASDEHYNPHGNAHYPAPHMGMSRTGGGNFTGNSGPHMSHGGSSPDGQKMQSTFGKKGSSKGQPSQNPALSQPYDSDGDDWM